VVKLAIVSTHPVQYNAPLFTLLAASDKFKVKVFYTWSQSQKAAKYDPGFGKNIEWDIPLLDGYDYSFVHNTSNEPGTHHFKGIINPGLQNEIEQWQPTALLVYGWSFVSHLKCIRYFHNKIPVLFRGDSTLLDEKPGIRRIIRRLFLKWVYTKIDYALYAGINNKHYFLEHGVPPHRLIHCPHAIDNTRFYDNTGGCQQQAEEKKAKLGITQNDLVILFAGKLEVKKKPLFLLELAQQIKDERLKFLVVGNGILEKEMKEKAAGDTRIQFIDFCNQSQMPVMYRTADVFILPSQGPGETWGLAANEAMASGLAVMLSAKAGGAADLVQENVNGIVFEPADVQKCTELISRLLNDKNLLIQMKAASRRIISGFTYRQTIEAIEKLMCGINTSSEQIHG
jgi:glycosyltransferase involved in cell wall biosynthesis